MSTPSPFCRSSSTDIYPADRRFRLLYDTSSIARFKALATSASPARTPLLCPFIPCAFLFREIDCPSLLPAPNWRRNASSAVGLFDAFSITLFFSLHTPPYHPSTKVPLLLSVSAFSFFFSCPPVFFVVEILHARAPFGIFFPPTGQGLALFFLILCPISNLVLIPASTPRAFFFP